MKKIILYTLLTGLLISLVSCDLNSGAEYLGSEETATEMVPMRSLLSGFDALMALGVEDEDSVDYGIRTIDPFAGNDNTDVAAIIGTDASPLSPEEVYNNLTGTGSEKRAPSTGYISDLYGEGNDAYFLISPEGTTHYRIKLYTFPRADFNVKYDYEEYLVEKDDTAWAFMNDSHIGNQLTLYKTYLADGTVAIRNIEQSYSGAGSCYADFTVGSDILGADLSDYTYPAAITEPTHTADGEWASYTTSVISKKNISVDEFYTEPTATTYSGVTYISQDLWRSSTKNTVTRFSGHRSDGSLSAHSLTVVSNASSAWQTDTDVIEIANNAGLIEYSRTHETWWSGPDAATGNSSHKMVMDLTETGVDTNEYSGTITDYWGSYGNTFNVSISQNTNGSYKLRRSGWSFSGRSLTSDSDITIDIDQLDNLAFALEIGNGSFAGSYVQGAFVGTYTIGNVTVPAIIDPSGISVEGTFYSFDQLVD